MSLYTHCRACPCRDGDDACDCVCHMTADELRALSAGQLGRVTSMRPCDADFEIARRALEAEQAAA